MIATANSPIILPNKLLQKTPKEFVYIPTTKRYFGARTVNISNRAHHLVTITRLMHQTTSLAKAFNKKVVWVVDPNDYRTQFLPKSELKRGNYPVDYDQFLKVFREIYCT